MTRDELAALRDALTAILTWPEPVLEQVAAWLAPEPRSPATASTIIRPRSQQRRPAPHTKAPVATCYRWRALSGPAKGTPASGSSSR
jgi:hypothetical protein